MNETPTENGRGRATIEHVTPEIDGGRFAIKRTVGERVTVEADVFTDGHDSLSAVLKYRPGKSAQWMEIPMQFLVNDRWRGEFVVTELGDYFYTVEAWVDHFQSWRADLRKKLDAKQDVAVDLLVGAKWIEAAAQRASDADAKTLRSWAKKLTAPKNAAVAPDESLAELMARYPDRQSATVYGKELRVAVDRERARCGAWYELFPRSFGGFKGCEAQLPRLAKMGFDVLYLPPIHPIGQSFRKGKNNSVKCQPGEPGSPWAIGAREGGHKAVHPELGTLEDFRRLIARAREHQIEIALDIAFQCAPDHPCVAEHPEWFRQRPDGTIQYAENPPKKYQDIVPFNFECDDWRGLWQELKSIFDFWIEQGVQIFRVDNPHTKPFAFWEWCLGELKRKNPGLIFLSEAFTRPKVMYRLAKLGFTQSYNYFPWRNTRDELESYLTEVTQTKVAEFFRPNLWPNTPDILTQFLQTDGPAAFAIRFVLAATLGASYGIYGPAFELCENTPRDPGGEEYLNSEKYEIKRWDLGAPQSLEVLIARVNQIRRANLPLQSNANLKFHRVDNPELIAYTKSTADGAETVLTVVNLSPYYTHSGWLDLPLEPFGLDAHKTYQMHDLLTDARYLWKGARNYVELNPTRAPAHIFRLRRHVRTERDFDYFM
jgi:starch synthase (maltosyl-transferring)